MANKVTWYPISPVMYNEMRSKHKQPLYYDCLIRGNNQRKPYDPLGAVPGCPRRPEGSSDGALPPLPPVRFKVVCAGARIKWTKELDDYILAHRKRGYATTAIARKLGIKAPTVYSRVSKLNLTNGLRKNN